MKIKFIQMRKYRKNHKSGEKGQAFLLVLIFLLVGTLIITSTLAFIGASIKTNGPYISNTNDLYAAEAGLQDGENNVVYQTDSGLGTLVTPVAPNASDYNQYDYNHYGWSYVLPNNVNNDPVNVTLKNTWVPLIDDNNPTWIPTVSQPNPPDQNPQPSQSTASNIINNTNLVVSGLASVAAESYTVTITYLGGSVPLPVISIGVWFPQGYTYNAGTSNLENIYSTEQAVRSVGNEAVIWSFPANTTFSSLETSLGQTSTNSITITFTYSPAASLITNIPDALAWVNCGNNTGNTVFPYDYTWDADIRVYDITSVGGHTQVEASVPTSGVRAIGAAMPGDYVATGGSLRDNVDSNGYRETPLASSSSTVSSIPTNSSIEAAYLYWSGWVTGSSNPNGTGVTDFDNTATFSVGSSGTLNETVLTANPPAPDILWYYPVRSGRNGTITISGTSVTGSGTSFTNDVVAGNYLMIDAPNNTLYPVASVQSDTQLTLSASLGNVSGVPYYVFDGYYYACKIDVTDTVKNYSQGANGTANPKIYGNGNGTYTVGGVYSDTHSVQHPGAFGDSAFAGWSLVIIYNNSTTLGHQLYLFDEFESIPNNSGHNVINISGFITPQQGTELGSSAAVRLTAFFGEGDKQLYPDWVAFINQRQTTSNEYLMWDGVTDDTNDTSSSPKDAFNSESVGLNAPGVDLDTYSIPWSAGEVNAADSSAGIDICTNGDGLVSIYVIASFRSTVTAGGAISYLITHK
jgi:Tfp pilus assembly protein PilX